MKHKVHPMIVDPKELGKSKEEKFDEMMNDPAEYCSFVLNVKEYCKANDLTPNELFSVALQQGSLTLSQYSRLISCL